MKKRRQRKHFARLGEFVRDNKLKPVLLADLAGISRQHLLRLRKGIAEPTRPVMVSLTIACRDLLRTRKRVRVSELFDLGDGEQ